MADNTETAEQVETPPVAPAPSLPAAPPRPVVMLEAQAVGVLPIVPTNIDEAQRYATGLIRAGQVPDAFKFSKNVLWTPEEIEAGAKGVKHREGEINAPLVLAGVLKALEMGVPVQAGLGGLLPLNGRFSAWGDLFVGVMQRGGKIANHSAVRVGPAFDPNTPITQWPEDYGWTVSYWRRGQENPYVATFTVRDAKRANLWANTRRDPWVKYPDRMLFNRARAWALRDGFADALIQYDLAGIAEEMLDQLPPPEKDGPTLIDQRRALLLDDEPETGDQGEATPEATEGAKRKAEGMTTLDSFLEEEGIREEVEEAARARIEGGKNDGEESPQH
jgi:hypothetical protein